MMTPLTQQEFDARLAANELHLTVVGMSNVGKSHWSELLHDELGFTSFCCDDLIEAELADVLNELGYSGINDVAKWMGQPYDPQFPQTQATYLDLETQTMRSIIDKLANNQAEGNLIVDTTGSVVHTDPAIAQRLEELTTVIYLEATADMQQQMFELYMQNPKPVVWGDVYNQQSGESTVDSLARCYPQLLARRSSLYQAMAQITIPRPASLKLHSAEEFLAQVRASLPSN